jgi:hypothetical protein
MAYLGYIFSMDDYRTDQSDPISNLSPIGMVSNCMNYLQNMLRAFGNLTISWGSQDGGAAAMEFWALVAFSCESDRQRIGEQYKLGHPQQCEALVILQTEIPFHPCAVPSTNPEKSTDLKSQAPVPGKDYF